MKPIFTGIGILLIAMASFAQNESHWSPNFSAGQIDDNGEYLGGTEIMYLIPHNGKIYAANSYWQESDQSIFNNGLVTGTQVFELDGPNADWQESLEMPDCLRTDFLGVLHFTRDYRGRAVDDRLLVAFPTHVSQLRAYVLDDNIGQWHEEIVVPNANSVVSIRAAAVHTDGVTGRQFLFFGLRGLGIGRAQYNPNKPGKFNWNGTPELTVPPNFRITGFSIVNGQLYASSSEGGTAIIYRRIDGPDPNWEVVWTDASGAPKSDIRGLSALPNPNGSGEVLWFAWTNLARRLDPFNNYAEDIEFDFKAAIANRVGEAMKGTIVAYNDNLVQWFNPVRDKQVQLIGAQANYQSIFPQHPAYVRWVNMGMYFERIQENGNIDYDLYFIEDNQPTLVDTLVAVRSVCISPFPQDQGRVLYAGGFDANGIAANETAWIYRGEFPPGTSSLHRAAAPVTAPSKIQCFPNPTTGSLQVRFAPQVDLERITVKVYNALGQLILEPIATAREIRIDLTGQARGVYLIRTQEGATIDQQTVIKLW